MIIFNWGGELKRVPNGKRVNLLCLRCHKQSTFHEAVVDDKIQVFFVLDLYRKSKRVMQCGECLGVCQYYEMFPDEARAEEQALTQARNEMNERQIAEEAKRKEQEENERRRQEEKERKLREQEKKRKDEELDAELEKLKKKLGK